ncbi:MAG: hypothetical protein R6T83_07920, partial [Salinibacter sp.]
PCFSIHNKNYHVRLINRQVNLFANSFSNNIVFVWKLTTFQSSRTTTAGLPATTVRGGSDCDPALPAGFSAHSVDLPSE